SDAATAAETDWRQIVALYDQLRVCTPTSVVAMNRAIAVAEADGAAAGLALLDGLPLDEYHLYHAARGELLQRLGRDDEAAAAFDAALSRTTNVAEQRFLADRRTRLRS